MNVRPLLLSLVCTKVEAINTDTNQYETVALVDEGELEFREGDSKN